MAFAVGGHKDSILWQSGSGSILKQHQNKGRGEKEVEFLRLASSDASLSSFVPRFISVRNSSKEIISNESETPCWIEMQDLLAGMERPLVMDIKIGIITYSPDATDEKKAEQSQKAMGTTTPKLGVRIIGASMPAANGGGGLEFIGSKFKTGEPSDTVSFAAALARFLPSRRLLLHALRRTRRIAAWFESQRDFAFIGSSLLLAHDAAARRPACRVAMIDFSHVYPLGGAARDENYLTGLHTMLRCLWRLLSLPHGPAAGPAVATTTGPAGPGTAGDPAGLGAGALPAADAPADGAAADWDGTARRLLALCTGEAGPPAIQSLVFVCGAAWEDGGQVRRQVDDGLVCLSHMERLLYVCLYVGSMHMYMYMYARLL
jgi:hypothetical protein